MIKLYTCYYAAFNNITSQNKMKYICDVHWCVQTSKSIDTNTFEGDLTVSCCKPQEYQLIHLKNEKGLIQYFVVVFFIDKSKLFYFITSSVLLRRRIDAYGHKFEHLNIRCFPVYSNNPKFRQISMHKLWFSLYGGVVMAWAVCYSLSIKRKRTWQRELR